ncbi:MAG: hypothetical protein AAGD14_04260 [Planctomycetota bacterium]
MRRLIPLLALVAVACGGKVKRYHVRVVEPDGRKYYAHTDTTLYSEAAGFVTFRDLVTGENVKLTNGDYSAEPCSDEEVNKAQIAWLDNPNKPPMGEYNPEATNGREVFD